MFQQNRAGKSGGAISASSTSEINISGSKLILLTIQQRKEQLWQLYKIVLYHLTMFNFNVNVSRTISDGIVQIHSNAATKSGGGIHLSDSNLYFRMETNISYNQANASGGGVHAVNSSITIKTLVHFYGNQAASGGGASLTKGSKLYDVIAKDAVSDVNFVLNYGGAIYVDDERENTMCSSNPYTGVYPRCFFQNVTKGLFINFNNNCATSSGDDLFGGLLDRCTVVSGTNSSKLEPSGVDRFKEISNITSFDTVSSKPVRLCPCNKNMEPDCSQQTYPVHVRNKSSFYFPVAGVDQVNQTVAATIQSTFKDFTLTENQTIRRIGTNCSRLKYRVS